MRLRLTVRRHALPEVNILWDLDVDSKPTTSRLLEAVNEVIPIESTEWGLEDYAVELKDQDNNGYELLHFQPLAPILKEDDTVLIRPLLTHDLKQRRLSGRHQISSDGKHLIDGIAFGRPRLKTPRDRPDVEIPPRKRRRVLALDPDEEEDDDEDYTPNMLAYDEEEEADDNDDDDFEPGKKDQDADGSKMFLLTNGARGRKEETEDGDVKILSGSDRRVRIEAEFDDADADGDSESGSQNEDKGSSKGDGLQHQDDPAESDDSMDSGSDEGTEDSLVNDHLDSELRDLQNDMMDHKHGNQASGVLQEILSPSNSKSPAKSPGTKLMDLETLDKLARLGDAFPQVSIGVRELALMHSSFDEQLAYLRLRQDFDPCLSLNSMLERHRLPVVQPVGLGNAASGSGPGPCTGSMAEAEEISGDEEIAEPISWISHFDNVGFPAGAITSGDGLAVMASIKKIHDDSLGSASTPKAFGSDGPPLKRRKMQVNGTDSPRPRQSSTSPASEVHPRLGNRNTSSNSPASIDSTTNSSNDSSSDSDSSSDESEDDRWFSRSGVGAQPAEPRSAVKPISSDDDSDDSEESESESDSSEEDGASDRDSSPGSDSDSGSDSGPEEASTQEQAPSIRSTQFSTPRSASGEATVQPTGLQGASSPLCASKGQGEGKSVPPGHGLHRTQKRNARRRAAIKAKREAAEQASQSVQTTQLGHETPVAEGTPAPEAEIEARKQALFRLAGLSSEATGSELLGSKTGSATVAADADGRSTTIDASFMSTMPATTSTQSFMSAAAPEILVPAAEAEVHAVPDPDNSWRSKITYTAVECCHDGVDLSEPPFPFVQRWDPQQQGYNQKEKRGGKGKQAQRNQSHFYDEDGWTSSKKRKLDDANDETHRVPTLNYDDPPVYEAGPEENHDSMELDGKDKESKMLGDGGGGEFTDMDDLPSLPGDLATLPPLNPGEAKAGMVITWKQYILGSATNWRPEVVSLTAIVVNPTEDVTGLEVVLARRDRNIESKPKTYDEHGNRVYDRFEAVDDDDSDDVPDSGYRVLAFADMIEPRIVQQPIPLNSSAPERGQDQGPDVKGTIAEEIDTSMADTAGVDGTLINHVSEEGEERTALVVQEETSGIADTDATEADKTMFCKTSHDQNIIMSTFPRSVNEHACSDPIDTERKEQHLVHINEVIPPPATDVSLTPVSIRANNQPQAAILQATSFNKGGGGVEGPSAVPPHSPPHSSCPQPRLLWNGEIVEIGPKAVGKAVVEGSDNNNNLVQKQATAKGEPVSMVQHDAEDIPGKHISEEARVSQYPPEFSQDSLMITPKFMESLDGKPANLQPELLGLAMPTRTEDTAKPCQLRDELPAPDDPSHDDIIHDSFPSSPPGHADPLSATKSENDTANQPDETVIFGSDDIPVMIDQAVTRAKSIAEITGNRSASPMSEHREIIQDTMDFMRDDEEPPQQSDHVFGASKPPPLNSEPAGEMDISISTERHDEISQLVTDADFRKGISPTVEKGPQFEPSSPSVQLQEEAAAASSVALKAVLPTPTTIIPNPRQQSWATIHSSPKPSTSPAPSDFCYQPSISSPGPSGLGQEPYVSSPRKATPKCQISSRRLESPSSVLSLRSGRQLNPDLSFSSNQGQTVSDINGDSIVLGDPLSPSRRGSSPSSDEMNESKQSTPNVKESVVQNIIMTYDDDSSGLDISDEFPSLETLSQRAKLSRTKTPPPLPVFSQKRMTPEDEKHDQIMKMLDGLSSVSISSSQKPSLSVTMKQTPMSHRQTSSAATNAKEEEAPPQPQNQLPAQKKPQSMRACLKSLDPIPPPRLKRKRAAAPSSAPFVIPAGSTVISLSSSPEPELEEEYRDGSADKICGEPNPPAVRTRTATRSGVRTRIRGNRMPTAPDEVQNQSQSPGNATAAVNGGASGKGTKNNYTQ